MTPNFKALLCEGVNQINRFKPESSGGKLNSGFHNSREFLYQASKHQLLEENSASGSYSTNIFHFFGVSLI
jgi:hypothetical protein